MPSRNLPLICEDVHPSGYNITYCKRERKKNTIKTQKEEESSFSSAWRSFMEEF